MAKRSTYQETLDNYQRLYNGVMAYTQSTVSPAVRGMLMRIARRTIKYVETEKQEFKWKDRTGQMRAGTGIAIFQDGVLREWIASTNTINKGDTEITQARANSFKGFDMIRKPFLTKVMVRVINNQTHRETVGWTRDVVKNDKGGYDVKTKRIYKEGEYTDKTVDSFGEVKTVTRYGEIRTYNEPYTKGVYKNIDKYYINGFDMLQQAIRAAKPVDADGNIVDKGFATVLISAVPYAAIVDAGGESGYNRGRHWFDKLTAMHSRIYRQEWKNLKEKHGW